MGRLRGTITQDINLQLNLFCANNVENLLCANKIMLKRTITGCHWATMAPRGLINNPVYVYAMEYKTLELVLK